MAYVEDRAIVLRTVDFSESSLIVTLLTRENGKIGAIAKGGRRVKSPFDSALDLLTHLRVVFLHKNSDALSLLTESKLIDRFRPTGRSLAPLYAGYYLAELLEAFTEHDDPHSDVFDMSLAALHWMRCGAPIGRIVAWMEVGLLQRLGHAPSIDDCVGCGCEVVTYRNEEKEETVDKLYATSAAAADDRPGRIAFSPIDGGVLCGTCRPRHRELISVSLRCLGRLRQIMQIDQHSKPQEAGRRMIAIDAEDWKTTQGELRGLLSRYITYRLGHPPKMHKTMKPYWNYGEEVGSG